MVLAAALLATLNLVATGCKSDQPQVTAVNDSGPDPADANMAPVENLQGQPLTSAPVSQGYAVPASGYAPETQRASAARYAAAPQGTVNESQQAAQAYPEGQQAPAPVERQEPQYQEENGAYAGAQDQTDDAQALSNEVYADVDPGQEAEAPPPPLPVYDQPPAPADDYLWTPGYWGYAPVGYYWVPGAWVAAPYQGALWTPGWWGPYRGRYCFHHGYWGRHVGFYGGIPYGFGYFGTGYHGGYWNGNHFAYNRAVTNVNIVNVRNVYNRTVIVNNIRINNSVTNRYVNNTVINNRVSYNGGRGGIQARPMPAEVAAFRSQRTPPMTQQIQNQRAAQGNRAQFFQQNGGRPQLGAVARPISADRVAAPPIVTQPVRVAQPNVPAGVAGQRPGMIAGRPGQMQPGQMNRPAPGGQAGKQVRPGAGQSGAVQPGQGNRPGIAVQPNQMNRPGFPAQAGQAARPGVVQPGLVNRSGGAAQARPMNQPGTTVPTVQPNQPGRPGAPQGTGQQGAFQNRRGQFPDQRYPDQRFPQQNTDGRGAGQPAQGAQAGQGYPSGVNRVQPSVGRAPSGVTPVQPSVVPVRPGVVSNQVEPQRGQNGVVQQGSQGPMRGGQEMQERNQQMQMRTQQIQQGQQQRGQQMQQMQQQRAQQMQEMQQQRAQQTQQVQQQRVEGMQRPAEMQQARPMPSAPQVQQRNVPQVQPRSIPQVQPRSAPAQGAGPGAPHGGGDHR